MLKERGYALSFANCCFFAAGFIENQPFTVETSRFETQNRVPGTPKTGSGIIFLCLIDGTNSIFWQIVLPVLFALILLCVAWRKGQTV